MSGSAYIPHTDQEIEKMLGVIGVRSVDALFDDIPPVILRTGSADIAPGMSEIEVYRDLAELSRRNVRAVSFLGGGSYDHIVPATVPYVLGRSEFATAYTPYQAEVSQGVLQAMFEYQTMIRMLTGLPIPNASLYDGATAAVEACAMAIHARRKSSTVCVSATVHPSTRRILQTYFSDLDVDVVEIGERDGETNLDELHSIAEARPAVVLLQTPNVHGIVEDLRGVTDYLRERNVISVVSSNPLSLGALTNQAGWGADIAVGDAQPFGLPSSFGGPSVGYIAATDALMRRMPGRIVGETVDADGRRAFVLTLQAREQHIKRARASSNICSNQALAALAVAAYLATVGKQGFRNIAVQNIQKAHYLAGKIASETTARLSHEKPFFNEFLLTLPCDAQRVVDAFLDEGYFAGVPAPELGGDDPNRLLVAVTEKRTKQEMDRYVELLKRVVE